MDTINDEKIIEIINDNGIGNDLFNHAQKMDLNLFRF